MTKIRMTQRRQMIDAVRRKVELKVAAAIIPILRRQGNALERFLRKPTLRKRLSKIAVPDKSIKTIKNELKMDDGSKMTWPKVEGAIGYKVYNYDPASFAAHYRVAELMKQDGLYPPVPPRQPLGDTEDKQDDNHWNAWRLALIAALGGALLGGITDIGNVENEIWTSRGYDALTYDPQSILDAYQIRTNRNLGDIADDTADQVQQMISQWYMGNEPFAALTDRLDGLFSPDRADRIAQQETGDITSEIIQALLEGYGFNEWIWDAILDDRTCEFCTDMHGRRFRRGDPMPPDAAHVNCRCSATPVINEES